MTNLSNIITDNNVLTDSNTQTVTNKTISGASNTVTNLNASQLSSGTVPTARLASGTADSTTYLRGDQTWAAAGLVNFAEEESTTSPNDTVYVDSFTVQGSSTDVDVALVAKGTGATLAQIPDGAVAGGDKRGQYATDWQKVRTSSIHVASGDYSVVVGGEQNRSSGDYAMSGGLSNAVTGLYATAFGGYHFCSSTGAVGLGFDHTASNTAACAVGYWNYCIGHSAFAANRQTRSDGDYSAAFGYETDVKQRQTAIVLGTNSTWVYSQNAAQTATQIMSTQTTDATPTLLNSGSGTTSSNRVRMDTNSAYAFKVLVVANVTGGGDTKAWELVGCIKKGASNATTALVGSVTKTVIAADTGASSWDCDIDVDTTNGVFTVEATGAASTTIRWGATVYTTEVDY